MKNNNQEDEHKNNGNNVAPALAGLVIGGLAGAGAALLLAPQSGKETRAQIQHKTLEIRDRTTETVDDAVAQVKSKTLELRDRTTETVEDAVAQVKFKTLELRDRTTETVDDAVAQVKSTTHQIQAGMRGKAEELQHQGQEMLVEQLDRVSAAAEAGKVALAPEPEPEPEKMTAKRY